jgi:hypothetical protein
MGRVGRVGWMGIIELTRPAVMALTGIALTPVAALACPVCFGSTDAPIAGAVNLAIFALLGVTGAVLGSFVAFFVYLARKAKQAREAEAYGEELLHG